MPDDDDGIAQGYPNKDVAGQSEQDVVPKDVTKHHQG
jgi:hypothetical protein